MNKNNLFVLCVFFVIVLITSLLTPVYANEKPVTLTLAEYKTPDDLTGRHVSILKEEIEEKTNGKVQIKIYWAESLLKGKEILRGVEDGVADIGNINPNYYPNQLLIGSVFNVIPRGPVKYESQMEIYDNVMGQVPGWEEEFLSHNQLPFYIFALSDKAICSTKPIESLEDFERQKMRAASRWLLDMMSSAGATPVSVPWGDCYMALQTGTIDSVLTNLDSLHYAKLNEVAKHILLLEGLWSKPAVFYTINLDTWKDLSEEIQGQIMEALEVTSERYAKLYDDEWNKVLEEVHDMGCIVNTMPREDMNAWTSSSAVDKIQTQWVEEMKEQGFGNAEEILEQIKKIVEEVVKKEELNI
jgi:TRAP-type C4-dicarboxylate transport system substrate-binding protein